MQCPKCGYQMSAFDSVCPRCKGEGLSSANPVQTTPKPTAPPQSFQPTQVLPQSGPNFGLFALILGIVSILLFLLPFGPLLTAGLGIFLGLKGIKSQRGVRVSKWGVGVSSVAFLMSVWLSCATISYLRIRNAEMAGRQDFRKGLAADVAFSNLSATMLPSRGNYNLISVTGDVQNSGTATRIVPVKATILNSTNIAIVSGRNGVLVPPQSSKHFEIVVLDRARTYPFTYKVEASID